jgi:2-keto-4-pentenoate hydratase/2-oxohepta-3-ene-1,7-dioic acid hydratase in catechol pathway
MRRATIVRLVTFDSKAGRSFGAIIDKDVVELKGRLGPIDTLAGVFAAEAMRDVEKAVAGKAPDYALSDVTLKKPLWSWGKCFCIGVNYSDRNEEYTDTTPDAPKHPSIFVRFPESFVGPDEPLIRPPESVELDYEGEVTVVIGKAGRRIPRERWSDHVAGFTICNEGTLRDWLRHGKFNVTQGKNFASSGSMGPWIIANDAKAPRSFRIVTRVNGEERQNDTTDRMIFGFGALLEYVSTFCTLQPGDVIVTGTPTGAGARLKPPKFLKPGDTVEVEVSGIGVLRNGIADEILSQ